MRAPRVLPLPLLANGDSTADALRIGNREFLAHIDEIAAFASLSARVRNQRPRVRVSLFAWPAFAALAVIAIVLLRPRRLVSIAAEPALAVPSARAVRADATRAEPVRPGLDRAITVARGERLAAQARPARASVLAKAHPSGELARDASALGSAAPSLAASASAEKAQPAPPLAKEASASPAGPDCLALARQGQTREAERCFVERARGSGLGAEMALYELGRLRRNVLADPVGALSALEEHALRFPGGSLRREVQMSSLELLVQLGRSQEALERSSALLAAQAGGGRAAELYLLRGDIFRRSLHDLRAAEREYGSAERLAGSAEAEATYLRGVCLEGLGESSAASEAYRRYLAKPSRPRAAEVQRRLERLELP